MKNMSSYLLVMFMVLFWIFRIVAAGATTFGIDIGIPIIEFNFEIILIFVTLVCIILVVKRNIIGSIIYLVMHGYYFGVNLFQTLLGNTTFDYMGTIISFIGVILPVVLLFEMLFDKNRKTHYKDGKTDWYYNNEQYDRKYDERADRNNYRTL